MSESDTQAQTEARGYFERARQAADAGDFDRAIDTYLKGLEHCPEAVEQGVVIASEQDVYDHAQPIAVVVAASTGQQAEVIVREGEMIWG